MNRIITRSKEKTQEIDPILCNGIALVQLTRKTCNMAKKQKEKEREAASWTEVCYTRSIACSLELDRFIACCENHFLPFENI